MMMRETDISNALTGRLAGFPLTDQYALVITQFSVQNNQYFMRILFCWLI